MAKKIEIFYFPFQRQIREAFVLKFTFTADLKTLYERTEILRVALAIQK